MGPLVKIDIAARAADATRAPLSWSPAISGVLNYEDLRRNPEPLDDPAAVAGLPPLVAADVRGSLRQLERVGWYDMPASRAPTLCTKLRQLRDAGVRLVVGSDSGAPAHLHTRAVWQEIDYWVRGCGIDAVAAILISLDVLHDGVKHTGAAIRDLSDEMPRTIDDKDFDPLIRDVRDRVERMPWVADCRLRLREEGRFLTGTLFVVPSETQVAPELLEKAERELLSLHWRLHDVSIMLRRRLEEPPSGRIEEAPFPAPPRPGAVRTRRDVRRR